MLTPFICLLISKSDKCADRLLELLMVLFNQGVQLIVHLLYLRIFSTANELASFL